MATVIPIFALCAFVSTAMPNAADDIVQSACMATMQTSCIPLPAPGNGVAEMTRIHDRIGAFAAALVMSLFSASAGAHAPQHLDACLVGTMEGSAGTVESVREVPLLRDLHFEIDTVEHSVRPELAEELRVRLDVGPIVVFMHRQQRRLRAGERVRVYLSGSSARLEREPSPCATPLAASRSPVPA